MPTILATCALLGVDEVYAVGSAQAVAMFAYGVADLCRPVALVTRPGNVLRHGGQAAAPGRGRHRHEGRPAEIAVLADDSADPEHVAADLLNQAEHDPLATRSSSPTRRRLADAVDAGPAPGRRGQARLSGCSGRCRHAEPDRPGRRRRRRARRRQRLCRRTPGNPDPRRRRGRQAGPQRRRDLRRYIEGKVQLNFLPSTCAQSDSKSCSVLGLAILLVKVIYLTNN